MSGCATPSLAATKGSTRRLSERVAIPVWVGDSVHYLYIRTKSEDGSYFNITHPGREGGVGFGISQHCDERDKADVLVAVGKLITELQQFAKDVEKFEIIGDI